MLTSDKQTDRILEYQYSPGNPSTPFALATIIPCCLGSTLWKADEIVVPNSAEPLVCFMENGEGFVRGIGGEPELTTFSLDGSIYYAVENPFSNKVLALVHKGGAIIVDIEAIELSHEFQAVVDLQWLSTVELVLLRTDSTLDYYSLASQVTKLKMVPPPNTRLSKIAVSRDRYVVAALAEQTREIFLWSLQCSDHLLSVTFQSEVKSFQIVSGGEGEEGGAAYLAVMLGGCIKFYDYEFLAVHWEFEAGCELTDFVTLVSQGRLLGLATTNRLSVIAMDIGARTRAELPLQENCWMYRVGRELVLLVGEEQLSLASPKLISKYLY